MITLRDFTISLPDEMYESLKEAATFSGCVPDVCGEQTLGLVILPKLNCNICGKEFDEWDASENFTIHCKLGYGTKFDGDNLELHICCKCMEDIIDSCQISPITEED